MQSARDRLDWWTRKHAEAVQSGRDEDAERALRKREQAERDLKVERQVESKWSTPEELPDLPPAPPLPECASPDRFKKWTEDRARCSNAPLDFAVTGALAAASAAIGRRCGIRPEVYGDFVAVPNLYGAIVGDPSLRKTGIVGGMFAPLERLESEAAAEHEEREIERHAAEGALEKAKRTARNAGGVDNLDEETRTDYVACKKALKEAERVRRYLTTDATPEKLAKLLEANPDGVLVLYDELSHFFSNLRKVGREQERAFYLTAWNGDKSFTLDRVGSGTTRIEAVCLSLFGSIQPGVLDSLIREAQKQWLGSDGLLQRFQLLTYPEKTKYKKVTQYPDHEARQAAEEVFRRLVKITPESVGATEPLGGGVPYLRFDAEAQKLYDEWDVALQNRIRRPGMHPIMVAHLAKYASLMPSLALIYHLVDHEQGPVSLDAAERAVAMCDYFEGHAVRIFAPRITPEVTAAKLILDKVREGKVSSPFEPRAIYRKGWTGLDKEAVRAGVDCLEDFGWVQVVGRKPGEKELVFLHPDIQQFAGEEAGER